jgi:hypothetical protein
VLLAGLAVLGLGLSEGRPAAAVAAAATGLGTGLFTTHAAPLLLGAAPPGYLSRVQAVLLLVQSVPLLAANLALGWLVDATSAVATVTACGGVLGLTGLVALAGPRLRRATDER